MSLTENTHIDTHTRTRGTRTLAPSLDYGSLKQTVPVVVFLEGLDAKVTLEGCYSVIDMRMTQAFRSSQMVLCLKGPALTSLVSLVANDATVITHHLSLGQLLQDTEVASS